MPPSSVRPTTVASHPSDTRRRGTGSRWPWRIALLQSNAEIALSMGPARLFRSLQPRRHGKLFRAQELRIEQLRLIAGAVVGEHGDDGVARPQVLGQPDRAGDVDAGRAAQAQPFVLEQVEDDRHRFLVGNQIGLVDLDVLDDRRHAPRPMPSVIEPPSEPSASPGANRLYIAAPADRRRR